MDEWSSLLARARASWQAAGEPRRVLAAVSGGADSVALLQVLAQLACEEGMGLFAVHVNHGLRPEADQDAAFTAALCRAAGIPCEIARVRVTAPGEEGAREARYAALLSACEKAGAQAIALAHHSRDQAETVLLHLLRGSGAAGLCGMGEVSSRTLPGGGTALLWRPFLSVAPEMLRAVLRGRGLSWREDATNARDDYLRNYVRHQVLPVMAARVPQAEQAICRAAQVLREENDCLAGFTRAFLKKNACLTPPCRFLLAAPLAQLPLALRRRAVRDACPVSLDYESTDALAALPAGETLNLPGGWRGYATKTRLHYLPPGREKARFGSLREEPFHGETGDGIRCQAIPRQALSGCELRARRPGDRIFPLGGPGDQSLQDYLVNKKVDRPFRDYLPLLCRESRVIWVIGVGPGEEARARPGEDTALLTYQGFLPGEITE